MDIALRTELYLKAQEDQLNPELSQRRKLPTGKLKKGKTKSDPNYNVHQKRLSQKCVVNVTRDDLEALKASWYMRKIWKELFESDSEDSSIGDMNFSCNICNKSCTSAKKLLNHQRKKHIIYTDRKPMKRVSFSDHVIIHEVEEYHKCRKCPKIFEEYRSLKLHTKQQHKKRKSYICNYCSKNFAERMIFKVHIKLHCEVCGALFTSKAKCVAHKRNVCRVIKLYKCTICDESFYNIMHVKDHSYEHNNASYICDICKDQFDDKCSIAHHISFLHAKKRPKSLYTMLKMGKERLYLCNFCDISSVEKSIVENHLQYLPDLKNRAMTGYKDYYYCEHCMKKFPTEKEMLQHKWTHFLKTSDNCNKPTTLKPELRKTCNVNEVPLHFQPKVVLTRLKIDTLKNKAQRSNPTDLLRQMLTNELPVSKKFPLIGVPVTDITSAIEVPVSDTTSAIEVPVSNTTSAIEVPVSDTTSAIEVPVSVTTSAIEVPVSDTTSAIEVPVSDTTSAIEVPVSAVCDIDVKLLKKAIVDPIRKKTLLSKHQCALCGKYFSTNYCLNRHITTQHIDFDNLKCRMCEETFVWPSLLKAHRCIRLHHPEMPFDDARPEIHFENLPNQCGVEDLTDDITNNDDYLHSVDFEIPAPIVELTEYDSFLNVNQDGHMNQMLQDKNCQLESLGYQLIEVPIEF